MKFQTILSLCKETLQAWAEDNVSRLASELAFYTILSLPPLFIICLVVASQVFGREAAQGQLVAQINGLIGENAAESLQTMIGRSSGVTTSFLAAGGGIIFLLFSASGVFIALQGALNTIWHVETKKGYRIWRILQNRFLSFGVVMGIAFLLLVSLVLSALLALLHGWLIEVWPGFTLIMEIGHALFSFITIALLFALIFKMVPDAETPWPAVLRGGMVTSFLFIFGKGLIGLYLGHSPFRSAYGAAGSAVVLLIWVYYSAQIVFLGAEFTRIYALHFKDQKKEEIFEKKKNSNSKRRTGRFFRYGSAAR